MQEFIYFGFVPPVVLIDNVHLAAIVIHMYEIIKY